LQPSVVESFVAAFVATADPIWTDLRRTQWRLATTGRSQYKRQLITLRLREHALYEGRADWATIRAFYDQRSSLPPLLRRQVEILFRYFRNNQSTPEENETIAVLEADVQQLFFTHRASVAGKRLSNNEISEILRNGMDESVRQEAWSGVRDVGRLAAEPVRALARARNVIARRLGFRDYYQFALVRQEIDEDDLFALFNRLAALTAAPYSAVKEEIDRRLRRRLGLDKGQALAPWFYADPFFQEVPPVFQADLDRFYADVDVAAVSVRAYDGMGLEVRDILERSDLYEREGKDQHAFCLRVDRDGDVRILCNLRPTTHWMVTQMHELGHAVYNKYLPPSLPYLLRTPAHTNSTEGIATLLGRLPRDPQWMVDVAGRDPAAVAAVAEEIVLERAAAQLIFVRWVLVMLHFERALYAKPDRTDLDELWWKLVEKYQRIERPAARRAHDWAAKYHLSLAPVYYHNYVLGELTASQLDAWLQREAGGLAETPAAGRLLVDRFFAHGARYRWDELITVVTGEKLQPDFFVEQYLDID
jgi:peptidyl-dipeptidase A